MQINIGGICAKCFACGGSDFVPLTPRPDEPADKLACADCCAEVLYDDLRSQIGRTVIARRQARSVVSRLGRGRREYEPPGKP